MANQNLQKHKQIVQAIEYLISGGIYFWFSYILLDLFYYALHWSLWWATIVSSVLGWVVNYWLQRYWVFKSTELAAHKTLLNNRYILITVVDFLLNYLILLGLKAIGIGPAIGQFGAAGFFTGWNYLWYRFWVFPDKADQRRVKQSLARFLAHRAHGHSAYWRS